MANENKGGKPAADGGNVVALPTKCLSEGCKGKGTRANFCDEHFAWYKEGLLTKEGHRPKDFDKKYIAFTHKKKIAA